MIIPKKKFVIDEVLCKVWEFNLAEIKKSIAKSEVYKKELALGSDMFTAFDIKLLCTLEEVSLFQKGDLFSDCLRGVSLVCNASEGI